MLLHRLGHYLRHNLWLVPLLCVLGAIGLALGATALDRYSDYGLLPQTIIANPNAAQSILSTIAPSMVMLTSIVLTLTLVVVQLYPADQTKPASSREDDRVRHRGRT